MARRPRAKKPIPKTPRAKAKIKRVLGEFKRMTLKSSAGTKVRKRKQAIAIALSEARRLKKR